MPGKIRVLVACGTSIATATVAANKVREWAEEAGLKTDVAQCKAMEVRGKIQTYGPHIIVAMTPVPKDLGVPVFNGIPFLSGIGLDNLKQEILAALKAASV
jgi:PTS system galactitol-specific IIB component